MTRTRSFHFRVPLQVEALETRDVPSFLPPVAYPLDGKPAFRPVVIDLNGDGRRDVAVVLRSQSGADRVAVLFGDGTGQLGVPTYFPVGVKATGIAVGDFNEDGTPDLVTANFGGSVSVLIGRGDGVFKLQQVFATAEYASQVAVGDINGDGHLDLAAITQQPYQCDDDDTDTLSTLLGNGDGTFKAATIYTNLNCGGANDVQIADLDGDLRGDVTVTGYWGHSLNVFYGNGIYRTFQAISPFGHALVDFNKDGHLDVVYGSLKSVRVLLNLGNGSFGTQHTFGVSGHSLYSGVYPVVADFNRDRRVDIAVTEDTIGSVLLGNGDGTFKPYQTFASDGEYFATVGLLNADRFPDIVVADYGHSTMNVILNDANWTPPIPPVDNGGHTLTMAILRGNAPKDPGDPDPVDPPPEFDQRGPGFPRIVNGTIDIGAFEVQSTGAPTSGIYPALTAASAQAPKLLLHELMQQPSTQVQSRNADQAHAGLGTFDATSPGDRSVNDRHLGTQPQIPIGFRVIHEDVIGNPFKDGAIWSSD